MTEQKLSGRERQRLKLGPVRKKPAKKKAKKRDDSTGNSPGIPALFAREDGARVDDMCAYIEKGGHFPVTAFVLAGGTERMWYRYVAFAREGKEPYASIVDRARASKAKRLDLLNRAILKYAAEKKDAKTLQAERDKLGKDQGWGDEVKVVRVDDEDARTLMAIIQRRLGTEGAEAVAEEFALARGREIALGEAKPPRD